MVPVIIRFGLARTIISLTSVKKYSKNKVVSIGLLYRLLKVRPSESAWKWEINYSCQPESNNYRNHVNVITNGGRVFSDVFPTLFSRYQAMHFGILSDEW